MEGMYSDPDLRVQPHPGRINRDMLRKVGATLNRIKWNREDVEHFIGIHLTDPKPHVFFNPPSHLMSQREFDVQLRKGNLKLSLKSRMLCSEKYIFLNGDIYTAGTAAHKQLEQLADLFVLPGVEEFDDETLTLLYQWYTYGYVELEL